MAAGAATIYRNYFAPVGDGIGQTSERQLDGLADLGAALGKALGRPSNPSGPCATATRCAPRPGSTRSRATSRRSTPEQTDTLRGMLRIGVHRDVEVTDAEGAQRPMVSQAFCSALPVAYSGVPRAEWKAFASLVLESAYEATLWAAVGNAQRGGSNVVLLTRLGGGAFGNDDDWIHAAMRRAIRKAAELRP